MSQINHSQERRYAEILKLSALTVAEANELLFLNARYLEAKAQKAYPLADSIRAEIMQWGAWPPENSWNAVAETPAHREQRLQNRLAEAA